jgi:hypothetical protein
MKIYLYILGVSFLVGCGSTSSSGQKKDSSLLTPSIWDTILVVEDMKKDVQIFTNRDTTNNITFTILNRQASDSVTINPYSGVVKYWAENSVGSTKSVTIEAKDSKGWKSDPLTLIFKTVSSNSSTKLSVLKTGADDGGAGKDRIFDHNSDNTIVDPLGNIWENKLEDKQLKNSIYFVAENRCEILRLMNKDSHWRVPTVDEMINLIDYSKVSDSSMLDDAFEDINMTSWVQQPSDNEYQVVAQSNGLPLKVNLIDKFPVRCINAPKIQQKHLIASASGLNSITYDFSTNLKWSPMTEELYTIEQNATQYCTQYSGDGLLGWRLPSINELRSVIEDGYIADSILQGNRAVISATPYNNSDKNAKLSNYSLFIDQKGDISQSISYIDTSYHLTCVKEY